MLHPAGGYSDTLELVLTEGVSRVFEMGGLETFLPYLIPLKVSLD